MNKLADICVMDCNNFWSPSGGGVRRYHLEKLNFFKGIPVCYVFVMQDDRNYTETLNETTWIEHVRAPKFKGNWEYRFLFRPGSLGRAVEKYRPHVVEVGSPYIMPWLARLAARKLNPRPALVSFWHADYPVTYVGRFLQRWNRTLARAGEGLAWFYARQSFKGFEGFLVSSAFVGERMRRHGLGPVYRASLGVDVDGYTPEKKDPLLIEELKAGLENRLTLFYPHRFMEEKGLRTLLTAYPKLCDALGHEPALVFAGTGPDLALVKEAADRYTHIRYLGFVNDNEEMARWYASCEMGLALSGHETFGLSILESMASGQALVGADTGAAMEHIRDSGAGISVPIGDPGALVRAIVDLRRKNGKILSAKARDYAKGFTWKTCFENELDIYSRVIEEHKSEH